MMPGSHIPPAIPNYPGRRQSDYQYHIPPQTHSPVPNPYVHYPQQHYHGHPHAPHYQQWYNPYQAQAHPQHYPSPRPYIPQHHQQPPQHMQQQHQQQQQPPVIVSSYPHGQPVAPVRQPVLSPPAQVVQTPPQPAPTTPLVEAPEQVAPDQPAPLSSTPLSSMSNATPPPAASMTSPPANVQQSPLSYTRMPFYPQLPWHSVPADQFPPRARRRRRRRSAQVSLSAVALELPAREDTEEELTPVEAEKDQAPSQASTLAGPIDAETPPTSHAPSETDSAQPVSPTVPAATTPRQATLPTHTRSGTVPAVPLIPITPSVPRQAPSTKKTESPSQSASQQEKSTQSVVAPTEAQPQLVVAAPTESLETSEQAPTAASAEPTPPPKPKSWAELLRAKNAPAAGAAPIRTAADSTKTNGFGAPKTGSLAEVLRGFSVEADRKLPFLEPRGLVNTGNMCYMNSVLQTLVFCIPFYDFLDLVGKRAVHSFKSDTPLLDAMIDFAREYKIIDSAESAEKLRMRLKQGELEQFGKPFVPEYVYDVIKRLPRFSTMRRGHQEDAEEFLGFLLEGLHDECAQVLKTLGPSTSDHSEVTSPVSEVSSTAEAGWMEVGPKQKPSITRSSGHIVTDSPITKIFGGKLRSEFKVPGLKSSVTLEPYQPLQLDIGAPHVSNIVDALKGLARSETIHGDFQSPRGPGTPAVKQVFIETLPPVLILHLKRFQYDNTGGTQKIWKKVGYPLELEIPKEVFPPHKRSGLAAREGLPKYRLTSVVYHHGKSASGGHYTVDARRQEGQEWIRMDDTVIRRVRKEDVAEGGKEEDPKALAAALEQHKRDNSRLQNDYHNNPFLLTGDTAEDSETNGKEGEWKEVNGTAEKNGGAKKWSGVVNGNGTATPKSRDGLSVDKERTPYILFYQQIR
ncbi:cysteine proteinase [Aulographum hederae CBS 113979]|uniref:Ubiquitin carboxyl-terminal hydrolase n=1 Tax=Aulographum hederae CBS 113979 TaxID=1176131 RepID=A0A6G1GSJ8_9PEZI|nr:cysteine proteinase [Aulographum hederae CBS 113979]